MAEPAFSDRLEPARPVREPLAMVERAGSSDRRLYVLQERITELELRLRERMEIEQTHDLELRAVQLDLDLKAAYVARLETDQGGLHSELARLNADRANLFAALEDTRQRLAEVGALCAGIQHQLSYRVLVKVVALAKLPLRILRRVLRALKGS